MTTEHQRLLAAALRRKEALELNERFDGYAPGSKPTEKQLAILKDMATTPVRYIRAANQAGKTAIGARECTWVFNETHPFWQRPAKWGKEPLQLLIACNTQKQFEEVIWPKLQGLLDPTSFEIKRNSTGIERIIHKANGNRIVVLTYHNSGDAQEKLQGFVAHWAWVDEMPHSVGIFEEIMLRVSSRSGYFLATFTPKVRNEAIRRLVDAAQEPYARVYRLRMFDNPLYASPEKQAEELEKRKGLPKSVLATILEGEWTTGDSAVFEFDFANMIRRPPPSYHPGWRHMEIVDPALSSKLGYMLWAEDPETGYWYMIKADYVAGIYVPELVIQEVQKKSLSYNVIRRVSDPHEVWYIRQASHMKVTPPYMGVYKKTERKGELIKGLQGALGQWLFVAPWCEDFIEEITSCQWSETTEGRIVNASSYHLLDCAQYGVDCRPEYKKVVTVSTWAQALIEADDKRIAREQKAQVSHGGRIGRRRHVW